MGRDLRMLVIVRLAGVALLALLALAVAGCGGGGGTDGARASDAPVDPGPPVQQDPTPPPAPAPQSPPATAPPAPADPRVAFGTQGPWPVANASYGAAQGVLESPVVGITTDEAQNRWVATPTALYLFKPGAAAPRRFTSSDGLHLADNPERYCETVTGYSFGAWFGTDPNYPVQYPACPVFGGATERGITAIVGGRPNEVFVGYEGETTDVGPNGIEGDKDDPGRHSGKIDWVRVKDDGTLDVVRFDLVAISHGMIFWHNRTIHRLLYDHFAHPGSLYAGTNHGVTYLRVDKWRPQLKAATGSGFAEWVDTWLQEWMGDHLHAEAHSMCTNPDSTQSLCTGSRGLLLGGWHGLALAANGDLWHAGKWAAGRILWNDSASFWALNGATQIKDHLSHDIGTSVFPPPLDLREGINLSAVAVAPDGHVWFASSLGNGIASWNGREGFARYSATSLGLPNNDVRDLVALPDGRLAVAHATGGLVLWNPATNDVTRVTGLPSESISELQVDTMVDPPVLLVATRSGGAALRVLP